MKYSKKNFSSLEEMKAFVLECENAFETRLQTAVDTVCSVKDLKVIGLSGPTCSGKTTTAKKLVEDLSALGKKVHVVSIDNFFKETNKSGNEDEDEIDLDSIDALDLEEFEHCVDEIFRGVTAEIPNFDFITGRRTGYTEIMPDPEDLYIFEGIQAVYPEITRLLHKFNSKSVYICVEEGIDVEGTVFEPNEIRLMRRIVRDSNFRGASPDYTMFLWQSVRRNEEKNIFPYEKDCDVHINSVMPYEINLLSYYLRPLLATIEKGSEYYDEAQAIAVKLEGIGAIPSTLVPDGSLYYEFIEKNEDSN